MEGLEVGTIRGLFDKADKDFNAFVASLRDATRESVIAAIRIRDLENHTHVHRENCHVTVRSSTGIEVPDDEAGAVSEELVRALQRMGVPGYKNVTVSNVTWGFRQEGELRTLDNLRIFYSFGEVQSAEQQVDD